MPDPRDQADSSQRGTPACPSCQSRAVRHSRGSYPHDRELLAGKTGSFWRCGNCGARFLGPLAPEQKRRRCGHGSGGSHKDLAPRIDFARTAKRWIFPILAILATIVTVIYILDRRAPAPDRIILPRS